MGPIEALANELLQREMAKPKPGWYEQREAPERMASGSMSPDMLHTIGGLADAASTYYFLKRGLGKEANPILGFTNNHPEATAIGALMGLGATKGIKALLGKKWPGVADALAANLGAEQLGLAVSNTDPKRNRNSFRVYDGVLKRHVAQGTK